MNLRPKNFQAAMEVAEKKSQALVVLKTTNSPNKKRKKGGSKFKRDSVCFHCQYFGGEFVNCTRKGCQKVYHPDCIGAQDSNHLTHWQCSRHICNECKKHAQYMCYTCENSFCKLCIKESNSSCKFCFKESKFLCEKCAKESNFLSVNQSKGFCKICIGRVVQSESNDQGCQEIFRSYWNAVKSRLRQNERTEIINRFKGSISLVCKDKPDGQLDDNSNNSGSAPDNLEEDRSKRRKLRRCIDSSYQTDRNEGISILCGTDWARKELLDFVALVKNGDASYLSHLDVRALLIEYIKRNNLRDPQYQDQIKCDQRLTALFGKACIKHFEMLKYLRSHLLKNDSQAIQPRAAEKNPSQVKTVDHREPQREVVENRLGNLCKTSEQILPENMGNDSTSDTNDDGEVLETTLIEGPNVHIVSEQKSPQAVSEYAAIDSQSPIADISKTSRKEAGYKRSKFYKILEHRLLQTKTDDYASIDVHNINLLYLKRDLLETMLELEDIDDKVIGSFVRITSSSTENPESYRLVKVVGIDKARQPYSVGEKKTNIMLKISSLNKTESLQIDSVSDQEFSEDECNCLRERIKSGIDSQITVREVEKKVLDLQEVRVNLLLEKERLTLRNRGDYLGEKGQRKEQQKLIMQCQLLNSSEELLRRIEEIPDIHSDTEMNLVNNAQHDAKSDYKRDRCMQQTNIGLHSEELNTNMVEKNPVNAPESSTSMVDIENAFGGKTDEPLSKEDEVQVIPEVRAGMNLSNMAQDDAKSDDTRQDNYTSQRVIPIGFGERIDEPSWKQDEVQEFLKIHSDPDLNLVNKAQGDANSDDNKQDNYVRQIDIVIHSAEKKSDTNIVKKYLTTALEPTTDMVDIANYFGERTGEPSRNQDEHKNSVAASILDNGTSKGLVLEGSVSPSRSMTASFISITDKLWHYEDPSGNIQGPFSMLQLCKWSTTSSFPANMRVWRKKGNPEDSLLLTDALDNTFSHTPRVPVINQCNRVHHVIDNCDVEAPLTTSSSVTAMPMEDLNRSGASSNPLPGKLACDPPPTTFIRSLLQDGRADAVNSQQSSSPKADCDDSVVVTPIVSQGLTDCPPACSGVTDCKTYAVNSQQPSSPKADLVIATPAVLRGVADNPSARSEVNGEQIGDFDSLANASIETQGFVEPPPHPASDETSIDSKESKQELGLVGCDKLNNGNQGWNSLVEGSSLGAEKNDLELHWDWDAAVQQNKRSLELFSTQSKNDDGQTRISLTENSPCEASWRNDLSMPGEPVDETTLYVGNLDHDVDEDVLYNEFCAFGAIVRKPWIKRDFVTGNPLCGFVTYESVDDSRAAKEVMNGRCLNDRPIKVAYKTQGFPTTRSLYIGNLDECVDGKILYDRFSEFGVIIETTVRRNRETAGCFGFVTYDSIDTARRALEATKGEILHDRPMKVNYAKERSLQKKAPQQGSRQLNSDGWYQEDRRNSHDGCRDIDVGGGGGVRGYGGGFNRGNNGMGYEGGLNRSGGGGGRRGYRGGGVEVYNGAGCGNERDYGDSHGGCRDRDVRGVGGREHGGGGWGTWKGCSSGHDEESVPPSNNLSPQSFLESRVETSIQDCNTNVINSPEICEGAAHGSETDGEKIPPPFGSPASETPPGFSTNAKTLYVGNLDYSVDEKILQERFSEFGTILRTRVVLKNHENGTVCFGYVTYESIEMARRAVDATNGEQLCGRRMFVNIVKEKFHSSLTEKAPVQGSRQLKNDGWYHEERRDSGEGCSGSYVRGGGGGGRGGGWRSQSNYNGDRKSADSYGSRGRDDRGRGFNKRGRSSGYGYSDRGSRNTNERLDHSDGHGNKQW